VSANKGKGKAAPLEAKAPQIPKDGLSRINLGDSFAEYDAVLNQHDIFVETNAYLAAKDASRNKCFYIGRRGTGKTAITIQLQNTQANVIQVFPEIFGPLETVFDEASFAESHQKPFKSLTAAFELALQMELVYRLIERGKLTAKELPEFAQVELQIEDNQDFDLRAVRLVTRILDHLKKKRDSAWLKDIKYPKLLAAAVNKHCTAGSKTYSLVIDRIDDSWDGTGKNVRFLTALMHACGELTTRVECARAMLFLRENVFERVRATDTEFARLETRVVGLDWTEEKLVEFVERRLNAPFVTKIKLGGPTWAAFLEAPDESRRLIFDYCQNRPRDVLTYVKFALENATSHNHARIQVDDLLAGRKRFSDSRLKDLGDEYDENYPRIQIVLDRFYGLGWRFTRRGIESLIAKLLVDDGVREHCGVWFFQHATPEAFVGLLFQIGFLGISTAQGESVFRSVGPQTTVTPAISSANDFAVHPMYRDALDLQAVVVNSTVAELSLGTKGLIEELPGGIDLSTYVDKLTALEKKLDDTNPGRQHAYEFEEIVGEVLELCFFRAFANIEAKSRTFEGHIVRDWIVSNRASGGFWESVRIRWNAMQVVWECKNYDKPKAEDFQQMAWYMNDEIGRFGVCVFRGDIIPAYWPHLKAIAKDKKGLVILLNDKDLKVFMRQSRAGKVKEAHIQDRCDEITRKTS
jgi:hypothetical protein